MITDQEIKDKIKEFFDNNFEILRLESGHTITEGSKNNALSQILCYWDKLKDIAKNVTDTEVRLTLPDQKTPKGRTYSIEGVVDIVKEKDETCMYDIKTHDPEYIKANISFYEDQINVYSYIWQKLRGNALDKTAVISTAYPKSVRDAIFNHDEDRLRKEIEKWNPLIETLLTPEKVGNTIKDFGMTVDAIEENKFAPPLKSKLEEKIPGSERVFGLNVCGNCDARFSCMAFREYASDPKRKGRIAFVKYIELLGDDLEQEQWVNANLETFNENIVE